MTNQPELFAADEVGERKPLPTGGYAARPGSGPAGETCKTCRHFRRVKHHDKTYLKCNLVEWTHGAGTDIKASAEACRRWEPKQIGGGV